MQVEKLFSFGILRASESISTHFMCALRIILNFLFNLTFLLQQME